MLFRSALHFQVKQTCLATALARSLEVSVFPVPAGPSGAPPRFSLIAPIKVLHKKEDYCNLNLAPNARDYFTRPQGSK